MSRLLNEVGNRYGRWTVIKRGINDKHGQAAWLCRCDCGNETVIIGGNLRRSKTKSCGCLRREMFSLPIGEASFNALINVIRQGAKIRNLEWSLTESQVRVLLKQDCHYCGIAPRQIFGQKGYNGFYIYNGIDRIDNSKGYTIDNVVSCCKFCNYSKSNRSLEDFMLWISRVYKHSIMDKVNVGG